MSGSAKRTYAGAAAAAQEGGFTVALDGKPVRTPLGRALVAPGRALAEAMAAEWQAQGDRVVPATMPLTAIVSTAIDRIAGRRDAAVAQIMEFAATDLLCYRADRPAELAARQAALWQPILDWAAARWGASLAVTSGVVPIAQPPDAIAALQRAVSAHDELGLAALALAAAALGSLVLGLALADGRLSADEAFAASQLDETWQNERWGEDAEAAARKASLRRDVVSAARLFALHPGDARPVSA